MPEFFIRRPIVAMVIAILTVLLGIVMLLELPIAQYPNIVPPQVVVSATYPGADAITVEESVATPIEMQMSGVDNMEYMYSVNSNAGSMTLTVTFSIDSDPDTDQILAQMRQSQADSQLPSQVRDMGVTVKKAASSPLILFAIYSPDQTYDATFLANYAYINLINPMLQSYGIGDARIFGAGQYAMRVWVDPDLLAQMNITVPEIAQAIEAQNQVNPVGAIGGEPAMEGQQFTYAARAQGRLTTPEEFEDIIVRARPDGSMVYLRDVARVEMGTSSYAVEGRFDGQPAAVIALYQTPGTNAINAANSLESLMEELSEHFPDDMDYTVALDTTEAVRAGIEEIVETLFIALALVMVVVFLFLQGWRATLIPMVAVPVSLIGTFIFFPALGFSINTLSLLGLVLAIGLVVDDAIVVVEAVQSHIERGLSPPDAARAAMKEVSGPVAAMALILAAVFIPTVFIPGITGELYQQFAVTIAISMLISAFNALSLSPALSALLLRPKQESHGLLQKFFNGFNNVFGRATNGYVNICRFLIRKIAVAVIILVVVTMVAGGLGRFLPGGFIPQEDQGYFFGMIQLPESASMERTRAVCIDMEDRLKAIPGVEDVTTVVGFNLLSMVTTTYNGFFFVRLEPWGDRKSKEEGLKQILQTANMEMAQNPQAVGFAFPPPAIPGVGTSGGVTFILQDMAGKDVSFLAENTETFIAAAEQRPELASVKTVWMPSVPQVYVDVLREKALKQGINLSELYQTVQAFMGGAFINYFNRFGMQWQVYVEADAQFRTEASQIGRFYVRNRDGDQVPLSSVVNIQRTHGPEYTMRQNLHRSAQLNANAAPGYSSSQAREALIEVFNETMPPDMGYTYSGMTFQEVQAAEGVSPTLIFALSLLFVFLILAALYESWSLPFSVLLGTPIAVAGAFAGLWLFGMDLNVYAQIGLIMLIGLAAKNAILIVEYARAEVEKGKEIVEASLYAARVRLRPILMTAFAFMLGCVPLVISTGSGAVARHVLGIVVICGMLAATCIAIFMIPALFYLIEKFQTKKGPAFGSTSRPENGEPVAATEPSAAGDSRDV